MNFTHHDEESTALPSMFALWTSNSIRQTTKDTKGTKGKPNYSKRRRRFASCPFVPLVSLVVSLNSFARILLLFMPETRETEKVRASADNYF